MPFANGRPLIGVSTMDDNDAAGVHAPRFGINQSYCKAVEAVGGVPILVPHLDDEEALRRVYEMLDGILVPGGIDVHPKFYRQTPHPTTDPSDIGLDFMETTMLPWAIADDMPILGICRGEQILNIVMGGTLIQDIYTQYDTSLDHRESAKRKVRDYLAHDIVIEPGTRLREIAGQDRIWVNTSHHQSIEKVGDGLILTAKSPDGIVEGIESPDHKFLVAIQCHPEELWRKHAWARRLFSEFVEAASEAKHTTHRAARSISIPQSITQAQPQQVQAMSA